MSISYLRGKGCIFLSFKKEGKRAQISIFFVVGLVLIISVGIFFFFRTRTTVFNPEKITEIHSTPITSYVDACVQREGMLALQKLGRQGGYIEFPENIKYDPRSYISEIPNSKLSKVPYWFYQGQLRIPSIQQMESDLSDYVTKKAYECVNEFSTFTDRYNVNIIENISVTARITAKTVQFDTMYPVDIIKKSDNQKVELRDYKTTLSVRLKESHEMAETFVNSNLEHGYLEKLTMHMILLDPTIPVDGLEFGLGQKELGFIPELKSNLYNLIREALSTRVRFSFKNKLNPFSEEKSEYERLMNLNPGKALAGEYKDVPSDFYDYKHFFFDIFDDNLYTDLSSNVYLAPDKYFLLSANPNKNGYLYSYTKPMSETLNFPALAMLRFWHFLYDSYYPVFFAVRDDDAFNKRGFTFKIAHPIHLQKNRPAQQRAVSFSSFEFFPTTNVCDVQDSARTINVVATNALEFNYWTSDNMQVNEVDIYYQCPSEICHFGNTSFSENGMTIDLPRNCYNGVLVAKKDGFVTKQMQAITTQDNFVMELSPIKEFEFDVKAYSDFACSDEDSDGVINLENCEYDLSRYNKNYSVFIQLESLDVDYTTYALFDSKNPSSNKINLTIGDHKLDIYLILDDGADGILAGGYKANITISHPTPNDFYDVYDFDAQNVLFKVYAKAPYPRNDEEIIQLYNFFENNELNHIEKLKPEFS